MPEDHDLAGLRHIPIEREPDIEAQRRRHGAPPQPPRVVGRSMHGGDIVRGVSSAMSSVVNARNQAGIDPSRLLVVEFTSLAADAREVFEDRLNAFVIDETSEARHITRVLAQSGRDESLGELALRIERADSQGAAQGAIAGLRLRRARDTDMKKARRAGAAIPDDLSGAQERLFVMDAAEWGDAQRAALEAMDISPISAREENVDVARLLVQFPTLDALREFEAEARHYSADEQSLTALPPGIRRHFFDALDWVGGRRPEDRMGARLGHEGLPTADHFALDVDLWHPGTRDGAGTVVAQLREVCSRHGGRVVEDLRTSSLVLARVEGNLALSNALLQLDIVAQVDLPPILPTAYSLLFDEVAPLPEHAAPSGTEPLVTVIDSGVLAGHPLLRGWVLDEYDFDSGEDTATDRQGHGTLAAGLAVYGSVARCLETGEWTPRVLVASGKVLRRDPTDEQRAVFPENHRPEKLVADAIRYYHRERQSRVFNLSIGNSNDVYAGGRQFAWAEALDQLARELDVVLIVSAGNVSSPPWPEGVVTREQFQAELRNALLRTPACRLCSPATAAIAVTVGAIARSARTDRHVFAAAPEGAPAPFSRLGPGYEPRDTQRAVKPEFVSFGGNYAVRSFPGAEPDWVRNDLQLGEPTTRLNTDGGRPLTAAVGTSLAAPQVSFAAAFAMRSAAETLGIDTPTANAARALLGACAGMPPCGQDWLLDPKSTESWDKLRLVGYGQISVERVIRPLQNDVCLLAEDSVGEDHWHLYAVRIPPAFMSGRGKRELVVSLAFDPPVRASRRDYLARTMWVEILKGLRPEEISRYRARHTGGGSAPSLPQSKILTLYPAKTDTQWSTLQVRRRSWTRSPRLPSLGNQEPTIHVLVGCQHRFPSGEDESQRYALALRFRHDNSEVELHQQLRSRIRPRQVSRLRVERRG